MKDPENWDEPVNPRASMIVLFGIPFDPRPRTLSPAAHVTALAKDIVPCTHGRRLRQLSVGGFLLTEAAYGRGTWLAPHAHARRSLVFTLEGSYRERLGQAEEEMRPGMLHVRSRDVTHSNMFGPDGARCLFVEHVDDGFDLPAGPRRAECVHQRIEHDGIRLAGRRIARERWSDDHGTALLLEGLILQLLGFTVRAVAERGTRPPAWLLHARDRLTVDPIDRPSITALAAEAGVHPSHFIRTFRRHIGVCPGTFVHQLRVDSACRLLQDRELSLAEIASRTGFADQSHFGRVFRRVMGTSPGAWRARCH